MSYLAELSAGTHPETGRLTRSWVYEKVSAADVDLWRRHQALLDPEKPTKHEALVADLSADDFHNQLRTHMSLYSKPPMLIHTDIGRTSISPPVTKAWIQPTGEELRGLDVSKPDVEGWLDLERVQGQGRSTSVRASDSSPINTTLTFTCPGLLLRHTAQSWTIYEGDVKCGLRIDPSSCQEYDTSFKGQRSYLYKNKPENERLQLLLKTVEPGYRASTKYMGIIASYHMSLTTLITAQSSASGGPAFDLRSEGITLTDTAGSVPISERVSFQDGSDGLDVLRVHDETPVGISWNGQTTLFQRASGRDMLAIRGALACEIPAIE